MAEDYYKTLGVSRSATPSEIKKAYRDLARKYHPDLNPDDKAAKEKFQSVQKAFDTLNDTKKREMYDRYGSAYESMGGGPGGPGGGGWSGGPGGVEVDLSDLFGGEGGFADMFKQFTGGRAGPERPGKGGPGRSGPGRGGGTAAGPRRGTDLTYELTIPFNSAVTGGEAQLSHQRGGGKVETVTVKIPAGLEDGKKIRLRGQGEPGPRGSEPGDILITVRVAPHPHFRRSGRRLDVRVPVTVAEAIIGAKVDVPTPKGTVSLTIPPGTSSGKRLRIKGHGVAPDSDNPGDLFAEVQIVLPEDIDDEDRAALERLAAKGSKEDPRRELAW